MASWSDGRNHEARIQARLRSEFSGSVFRQHNIERQRPPDEPTEAGDVPRRWLQPGSGINHQTLQRSATVSVRGLSRTARAARCSSEILEAIPGIEKPHRVSEEVAALVENRCKDFRERFQKK